MANENSVINYSPSCNFKPVRPSFIFGTQIVSYDIFPTLLRFDLNENNVSGMTQLTQNSIHCLRPADTLQNGTRVMQRRKIVE